MSAPADGTAVREIAAHVGDGVVTPQETRDAFPTLWVPRERLREVVACLRDKVERPYRMLYDVTAIDERVRRVRGDDTKSDFTVVYHLLSFDRNDDIRLKVPLHGETPSLPTISDLWPSANWYEREVWDMFGIAFDGHPHLRRILMLLARNEELCQAVRGVLRGEHGLSAARFHQLRSAGVLSGYSARAARPRCRLYGDFLSRHLLGAEGS